MARLPLNVVAQPAVADSLAHPREFSRERVDVVCGAVAPGELAPRPATRLARAGELLKILEEVLAVGVEVEPLRAADVRVVGVEEVHAGVRERGDVRRRRDACDVQGGVGRGLPFRLQQCVDEPFGPPPEAGPPGEDVGVGVIVGGGLRRDHGRARERDLVGLDLERLFHLVGGAAGERAVREDGELVAGALRCRPLLAPQAPRVVEHVVHERGGVQRLGEAELAQPRGAVAGVDLEVVGHCLISEVGS